MLSLRRGAVTAIGLFLVTLSLLTGHYIVFGYVHTSDLLHALLFAPESYVFPAGTLMSALYSTNDMIAGAIFVIGVWGALLLLAWLLARLHRPEV